MGRAAGGGQLAAGAARRKASEEAAARGGDTDGRAVDGVLPGVPAARRLAEELPHVALAVVQRLKPQDEREHAQQAAAPEEPHEAERVGALELESHARLRLERLAYARKGEQQRRARERRRHRVGGAQRGPVDASREEAATDQPARAACL